jgi:capsular polysaccharide biosynthesis protein
MSDQALDLKGSLRIIRRYWVLVTIVAVLGLAAGAAYTVVKPPTLSSSALVRIASTQSAFSTSNSSTLVVIASSDPVLSLALPNIHPPVSKRKLQKELQVTRLTSGIISIRAHGPTAAQAENTANAVANGFVAYIGSPNSLSGSVRALVLQPASTATGRSLAVAVAIFGAVGLLVGTALGAIGVLAVRRRDQRLRQRDEIADSIGLPVLASIPVAHPSDAAGWVQLLTGYKPAAVDAWRLRGALDHLGVGKSSSADPDQGEAISLDVFSMRSDPRALALGPQLAVFAATLGIRTHLVVGPQRDPDVTAMLRAACTGIGPGKPPWSTNLQVSTRHLEAQHQAATALTVTVAVLDEEAPPSADWPRATAALLGVSAGVASAEDLAQTAVRAADRGSPLVGILVADPDPADHTTGRLPQLTRTTTRQSPTRLTGIPTETRQWMTQSRRP